jgi:hypothetical protein
MNKKTSKILHFLILFTALSVFLTSVVYAVSTDSDSPVSKGLVDPMGLSETNPIPQFITRISGYIFAIASPLAILMGIWAAVLFISAGGNPERVKQGKQTLTYAVIGLAVVLLANSMVNIVQTKIGETGNTPQGVIKVLTNYLPTIGGPLAIVMFVIGAFLYATGNPKNISKAYQIFIWTSVGLVLLILAASIGTIVRNFITP